ncbi:ABC transporter permease [Poseidonocella sp. HB161398]|uniref:ABC transporter permease n=1 Tax=Poseidonocella sp. HB161398 TaxID=2320855 RepID=UPI0011097CAF|nr:ABC transporter permease [Poseidonocella sp. HB161398]
MQANTVLSGPAAAPDPDPAEMHDAGPPPAPVPRRRRILPKGWAGQAGLMALSLLAGLAIWQMGSSQGWNLYVNFANIPSPGQVGTSMLHNLGASEFYVHLGVSIQRVLVSFALAVIVGVPVGLLMARSRVFRAMAMPYIEILRPIPAVAWIPLAILMWPTEESSIVFITFLGAVFPIVLNTLHGARQTPEVLVRAALSLGASRLDVFRHVILPAALPSVSAGLAVGMGVAWFSLLAGEIISGQYGIGYFTWDAYSMVRTPDIVLGMLAIGLLGTASTAAVNALTAPLLKWQKRTR